MSYIGTNKIGKIYLGSTAIGKAYFGEDLVFDSTGGTTPVLPYDAEIEYIQTSGTQYINTGIVQVSRNFEVQMRLQWVGATASQFESFFAYMAAGNSITPRSGFHKYVGSWMFGTNTTTSASAAVDGNIHDVSWTSNASTQKEQLFLDGTKIGEGTTTSTGLSTNTIPFFIGCRNRNGSTDNPTSMRIMSLNYKYFSDAEHTTLVQEWDFIPVRVGTIGCMYDKVSGQLLGNSGSGSFVLGNDVGDTQPELPEGYIECEYISHSRSSYPPYINTGVKPTSEYRIVAKIENAIDNTEKYPPIFGIRGANSTPRLESFAYKTYAQSFAFTGSSFGTAYRTTSSSPHTIDLNKNRLIYDGVEYPSSDTGTWTSNLNFAIGTFNNNGTFSYGYSIPMKFYYFKIYDGDTLVRDFIPAYKVSSQKYGFYDLVTGTFYSSARSGYEFSGLQKTT